MTMEVPRSILSHIRSVSRSVIPYERARGRPGPCRYNSLRRPEASYLSPTCVMQLPGESVRPETLESRYDSAHAATHTSALAYFCAARGEKNRFTSVDLLYVEQRRTSVT